MKQSRLLLGTALFRSWFIALTLRNHDPASSRFICDIFNQQASTLLKCGNMSSMLVVRLKVASWSRNGTPS